ncbi:hypothetical protein [Marinagarivorans algicola]|uniref:hypothetical protein n=1 Tax=Marinagarivorans algicola TaxID=1513270 RepID=UPI0012E2FE06|nr:hypothetical protein [Marinagarivorans algicola]
MPFDFVISLSLIIVVAMLVGMGYAIRFAAKHIAEDAKKAEYNHASSCDVQP